MKRSKAARLLFPVLLLLLAVALFAACDSDGTTHSHTIVRREGVAATCQSAGLGAYYECSKCGELFSDEWGLSPITVPPIQEKLTYHTFGADGFCSGCGGAQCAAIFVYPDGITASYPFISGDTAFEPAPATKENCIFLGWSIGEDGTDLHDFSTPLYGETTFYPRFDIDAIAITNKVTTETIKSTVKIYAKSYNSFLGFETSSYPTQGSGVIFHQSNGYCYVLTNCHVAQRLNGYDKIEYTIVDYKGNEYSAWLFKGDSKPKSAIDPAYDLATLYFKYSGSDLGVIEFAAEEPAVGDHIVALGSPAGQNNAITYGKYLKKTQIWVDCEPYLGNVQFPVLVHNAETTGGSSGGPLLNSSLELVGLNYSGNDVTSNAIPIEKINEFLSIYVYK